MICMVRTLGAPVTEAHGKRARKISLSGASVSACTVEVIWKSVRYRSTSKSCGASTLPVRAMRPRSFRIMSTIMTFSARFFGDR